MHVPDMSGKTVVVTGANSGIGFETAAALGRAGAHVVMTGRDAARTEEARRRLQERVPSASLDSVVFDLASLASVRAGADELIERLSRIDVLINNAGLMLSKRRETVDGFEETFAINHLGPFLLTSLLMPRIRASAPARIVNVASAAHRSARRGLDFADLQSCNRYIGMEVYGRTKLANIYFTMELARRLEGTGVTANSLHPGTVGTGFARDGDATGFMAVGVLIARPFMLTAARGARTSIYLASSPEVEGVSGKYFVRCRARPASKAARDQAAARRLWEESERLVGLVPETSQASGTSG
jgi:NAD(P)-dependent dehydrogenase (short-subunit alcohol dehydrogenase family)